MLISPRPLSEFELALVSPEARTLEAVATKLVEFLHCGHTPAFLTIEDRKQVGKLLTEILTAQGRLCESHPGFYGRDWLEDFFDLICPALRDRLAPRAIDPDEEYLPPPSLVGGGG